MSDAVRDVKPKLDGCLVTVVNNLSLDDNQNCETSTVAVDDNDNMACILYIIVPDVLIGWIGDWLGSVVVRASD